MSFLLGTALTIKTLKDLILLITYGGSWIMMFDLASFLEDFDVDITDLKEDVLDEIENELDDLTVDELKNVDIDELVVNSIEVVIQGKEELNDLPEEKKDEVLDYLYKMIMQKDVRYIESNINEIVEDAELYNKSIWKYNGVSPKDFLP